MRKYKGMPVDGTKFYALLYADSQFCKQLGHAMLAAGRLETALKQHLSARSESAKTNRSTLGQLLSLAKEHGLLKRMQPALALVRDQRNYLAHSIHALLSGWIEETVLESSGLLDSDVVTYRERAWQLAADLNALAGIMEKENASRGSLPISSSGDAPSVPPTAIQEMFKAFREQCIWLQCCYNTYSALYESGAETDKLLFDSASLFFHDLNNILIEYCWLQVCKITDPEGKGKRKNLTAESVNSALSNANLMTEEIFKYSEGLFRYRNLIKGGRNKVISHLDKESVLDNQIIGGHAKEEVTAFFENLYGYVDAVGNATGVGPLDFRAVPGPGDAHDLIIMLRKAQNSPSARVGARRKGPVRNGSKS
jgi:hypothetical protein